MKKTIIELKNDERKIILNAINLLIENEQDNIDYTGLINKIKNGEN